MARMNPSPPPLTPEQVQYFEWKKERAQALARRNALLDGMMPKRSGWGSTAGTFTCLKCGVVVAMREVHYKLHFDQMMTETLDALFGGSV
jgi:hypothetical protein